MKKILFPLIIILLFTTNVFAYTTPRELAKGEDRVEDVANWIVNNIHYYKATDKDYYWQKSEETLRSGTGDCKDFATLFYDTIRCYGYNAFIYEVKYKEAGHAICVFKNRYGDWQIFDTSGLHKERLDDIGQLIRYTYLGCRDYEEIALP